MPALEYQVEFEFGVTQDQRDLIQWYLEEYLRYPWGEFHNRATKAVNLMKQLGEDLFRAVFGSKDTSAIYAEICREVGETRIVISAGSPEGISIPWELMRDPALADYGEVAKHAYAFVRSQPEVVSTPKLPFAKLGTLNILMVISRPGGEADIPFQSVARPLLEVIRQHKDTIHLDILRPPTFEQLSKVLGDRPGFYQVLHFDGHGTFPQTIDNEPAKGVRFEQGLLVFEDEHGEQHQVTGEEIGNLLVGKRVPAVILNACRSGMTHPESVYTSVGNQLLAAGVDCVAAMSYSVYVEAAIKFLARLYEAITNGEEFARAVTMGREALWAEPRRQSRIGETSILDWIVPVVFQNHSVCLMPKPTPSIHLDVTILEDRQSKAGAEIDCPEPPVFGFIGRDGPILELERLFRTYAIVLLNGMAGIGKTEFSLGFARWWAETGALQGPVFFFNFEHYLPLARICDRVGQILQKHIKERMGVEWQLLDSKQRYRTAVRILEQVPCLMIWDNFEQVAGFPIEGKSDWNHADQEALRRFLNDLHSGHTKVLVTSRQDETWLRNIYHKVGLPGLEYWDAQHLAVQVMERAGMTPQQIRGLPQYVRLLDYLQGNPLAIQIVFPELKRFSPDDLLAKLQLGEAELQADDPSVGRQRSLAASLMYGLAALDNIARRRLSVLALFQGFVATDILAAISSSEGAPALIQGLDREGWFQTMDLAARSGLCRSIEEGKYVIHPALPWLFHRLLSEELPNHMDWLNKVFVTVYSDVAKQMWAQFEVRPEPTITRLGAEEHNLMHALKLARFNALWDCVEGLLLGISRLLGVQGRWIEREHLIASLEKEVTDSNRNPLPGRERVWRALLQNYSDIAHYRRDFEHEYGINTTLKDHYHRIGDRRNYGVALHKLGNIAIERRRFPEAERLLNESLSVATEIGDEHGQVYNLKQLGLLAHDQWQLAKAEKFYRQSIEIAERIGNEHAQAGILHQLGLLAQQQRRYEQAEGLYEKSLTISSRIEDLHSQALTLHQLAMIAEEQDRFGEAENWGRQALALWDTLGDEHKQAMTLSELGLMAQRRRLFDEAEGWYHRCLELIDRLGDEELRAGVIHQLGTLAQEQNKLDEAEKLFRQSLAISERIGHDRIQSMTLHHLANITLSRNQFDTAEKLHRKSLAIRQRLKDLHGQAGSFYELGRIAHAKGDIQQAMKLYRQAEALCSGLNDLALLHKVQNAIQLFNTL